MASSYHRTNIEKQDDIPTFYDWHKNNYRKLSIKYEKFSTRYIANLKEKLKIQPLHTMDNHNIPNISYLNYDRNNLNNMSINQNDESKSRIKTMYKYFIIRGENELKHIISTKLLNQSFYEKHISIKILEIRNQKSTLITNRKHENDLLLEKLNANFHRELQQQKHCINFENIKNYLEEKRVTEVDKKLHEFQMLQAQKTDYSTCIEIIDDILDLTIKIKEYENKLTCNFSELIWKEWATANQNLSKITDNINSIIYDKENNRNTNLLSLENDTENQSEITNYLILKPPWNLEIEPDSIATNFITLGANILCHIVHKLLFKKYPISVPNLPNVQTASSVIGILDERISQALKTNLKIKNITLIQLHKVITFCLRSYLKEKEFKQKYKLKLEEITEYPYFERHENSLESLVEWSGEEIMEYAKETQTSDIFYGGVFNYSRQAELGKCAYSILSKGHALNSQFLTVLLMQYLQTLHGKTGWVLENYPELLEDAINLELGLTGKLAHNEICEEHIDNEYLKRVSQLASNLKSTTALVGNKSYLTSFVHLIKTARNNCGDHWNCLETEQELVSPTDVLFSDLGCHNFLSYNAYNQEIVKELVNLIKQDKVFEKVIFYSIVESALDSIDQEKIKTENEVRKSGSKGPKQKSKGIDKKSIKDKEIDRKGKDKKSSQKQVKKNGKSIDSQQERLTNDEDDKSRVPGASHWTYIDLPQTDFAQERLATLWNNTEATYINSLSELLVSKRVYTYSLLPYVLRVDTYLTNVIEKPTNIETHLCSFQEMYNNLKSYLLEDDEFKAELYCRISELKTLLNDLCLEKMTLAEKERVRLINDNWFSNQTVSMLNIYVSAMQIELNRFAQTLQLCLGYYTSMLGQALPENKFKTANLDMFKYTDPKIVIPVADFLINPSIVTIDTVINILNQSLTTSINLINSWNSSAEVNVNNLQTVKGKEKIDKKKKKNVANSLRASEVSQNLEITKNILNLKQEYLYAVKGEFQRVKFRLNLINAKSKIDIAELLSNGKRLFTELNKELLRKYEEDLDNIVGVCEVFCKSVEACEKLDESLIMKNTVLRYDDESIYEI